MRDNVAAAAGGNAARRHTRALQLLQRVGGVAAAVPSVSHPPGSSNMFQVTSENEAAPLSHDAAGEGMMMNCRGQCERSDGIKQNGESVASAARYAGKAQAGLPYIRVEVRNAHHSCFRRH